MSKTQCGAAANQASSLPEDFVLVQILGDDEGEFPDLRCAREVLRLRFDDVHEDSPGLRRQAGIAHWPDHGLELTLKVMPGVVEKLRFPGLEHAREIVEFCRRAHECETPFALVVHCLAGASRSHAVALSVSEQLGIELERRAPGKGSPNPRLRRLLSRAWDEPAPC
ncbi:hypothetical protein [Caldimonas tepidiphila]|uniref:hypothetical protein n=1 Tax=Caldimonas tepidiphila TaxID=2315841 RepID=UPI001300AFA3|nr:hypothetical protein [Caldimonas tepidiphila]